MSTQRQRLCSLVLAVSIAAAAAPSAVARPVEQLLGSDAAKDASSPPVQVVRATPESSFDWGDAEIGAGAALAAGLAGAGGALAVRRRRQTRLARMA